MSKKDLNKLFGAIDKQIASDTKTVEVAGIEVVVTPLTMKMFTDFAVESEKVKKKLEKTGDEETDKMAKTATEHGSMIRMFSERVVSITVNDVIFEIKNKKEAEEALGGLIMRLSGDDAGKLLDGITEAIGLAKMIARTDGKDLETTTK